METTEHPAPKEEAVNIPLLERRRPSLHLRDIVEKYMQSQKSGLNGGMHPALNTNDPRVTLDTTKHKWVDTEIEEVDLETLYKDVKADEEAFLAAMEFYDKNAEPKYKVGINMKETHTIDEVIKAIDDAKAAYDEKEQKGFFAPLRKAFRKLGENEELGKAWLGLLPGESQYFSIICGGIKLILGAAGRLRKINDEIVNALIKIPGILNKSRRVAAVYKVSPTLCKCCSALYVAVLHAMGHILQYYQQRAIPKAVKVFAGQASFGGVLMEKISVVVKCSNAVDAEAMLCAMELGKETNQVAKKTKQVTEGIYEKTGALQDSVESLRRTIYEESTLREQTAKEQEQEAAKMKEELRRIKLIYRKQSEVLNMIADYFEANPRLKEIELRGKETGLAETKSGEAPQAATPYKKTNSPKLETHAARVALMSRLSYEKDVPRADTRSNLRHAMSLSREDQDRAVYMMQSELLQSWLRTTRSSALLVNGRAYNSGSRRSPLSFVCAKLSNALRQARRSGSTQWEASIIDLHFFCGEHEDWRDNPDNGPAGVLNSLLAQLLTHYKQYDLTLIKHLSTLDPFDVKALGRVFGQLLSQLPSTMMVFCIIDGLSLYDDEERKEDAEKMLSKLISLTRRTGGCIFKLLLTAATELRLPTVEKLDEEEEVLRIPEVLEKGDGFTDMKWDMGAGRDIADLAEISLEG